MKKLLKIFIICLFITLTGCTLKSDTMDDINITTSTYPIEYVVSKLYGDHSTINSIYPIDDDIANFEVTNTLLNQYSDTDLFIFNGLSDEKDYVKHMIKKNNELKIIDVTSNMTIDDSIEEVWLDPNNLLTVANNIKKGFKEYIKSTYLTNEIDENYEELKIELTNLDGKYFNAVKNSTNTTIVVSDDAFLYLEKYGLNVLSLDPDTVTQKTINEVNALIEEGNINNIFIKYGQEDTFDYDVNKLELYTMTNLKDIDVLKTDYIVLMNQNLENLKTELYK